MRRWKSSSTSEWIWNFCCAASQIGGPNSKESYSPRAALLNTAKPPRKKSASASSLVKRKMRGALGRCTQGDIATQERPRFAHRKTLASSSTASPLQLASQAELQSADLSLI